LAPFPLRSAARAVVAAATALPSTARRETSAVMLARPSRSLTQSAGHNASSSYSARRARTFSVSAQPARLSGGVASEVGKFIGGQRPAEVEALRLATTLGAQERELLGSFHTFGDRVQPQAVRKTDDGIDDGAILRAAGHAGNERLIDLELIRAEAFE